MDKPKRRKKAAPPGTSSTKKAAQKKRRVSSKKATVPVEDQSQRSHVVVDPRIAQAQDERTVAAPPAPMPELKESRLRNIAFIAGKTVARFMRKK